ncbi:MAG: hypothetical protein JRI96_05100 [Deltaproteobacteria bacterium]|nr:hypothetical protein [Deltaproteobacteria bacterium]
MKESGEERKSGVFQETQKPYFKPWLRVVALIIVAAFLYQDVVWAIGGDMSFAPVITNPYQGALPDKLAALFSGAIPSAYSDDYYDRGETITYGYDFEPIKIDRNYSVGTDLSRFDLMGGVSPYSIQNSYYSPEPIDIHIDYSNYSNSRIIKDGTAYSSYPTQIVMHTYTPGNNPVGNAVGYMDLNWGGGAAPGFAGWLSHYQGDSITVGSNVYKIVDGGYSYQTNTYINNQLQRLVRNPEIQRAHDLKTASLPNFPSGGQASYYAFTAAPGYTGFNYGEPGMAQRINSSGAFVGTGDNIYIRSGDYLSGIGADPATRYNIYRPNPEVFIDKKGVLTVNSQGNLFPVRASIEVPDGAPSHALNSDWISGWLTQEYVFHDKVGINVSANTSGTARQILVNDALVTKADDGAVSNISLAHRVADRQTGEEIAGKRTQGLMRPVSIGGGKVAFEAQGERYMPPSRDMTRYHTVERLKTAVGNMSDINVEQIKIVDEIDRDTAEGAGAKDVVVELDGKSQIRGLYADGTVYLAASTLKSLPGFANTTAEELFHGYNSTKEGQSLVAGARDDFLPGVTEQNQQDVHHFEVYVERGNEELGNRLQAGPLDVFNEVVAKQGAGDVIPPAPTDLSAAVADRMSERFSDSTKKAIDEAGEKIFGKATAAGTVPGYSGVGELDVERSAYLPTSITIHSEERIDGHTEPLLKSSYRGSYRIEDFFRRGTEVNIPTASSDKPIHFQYNEFYKPSRGEAGPRDTFVLKEGGARRYFWDSYEIGIAVKLSNDTYARVGILPVTTPITIKSRQDFENKLKWGVEVGSDGRLKAVAGDSADVHKIQNALDIASRITPDNIDKAKHRFTENKPTSSTTTYDYWEDKSKTPTSYASSPAIYDQQPASQMQLEHIKYYEDKDTLGEYSVKYDFEGEDNSLSRQGVSWRQSTRKFSDSSAQRTYRDLFLGFDVQTDTNKLTPSQSAHTFQEYKTLPKESKYQFVGETFKFWKDRTSVIKPEFVYKDAGGNLINISDISDIDSKKVEEVIIRDVNNAGREVARISAEEYKGLADATYLVKAGNFITKAEAFGGRGDGEVTFRNPQHLDRELAVVSYEQFETSLAGRKPLKETSVIEPVFLTDKKTGEKIIVPVGDVNNEIARISIEEFERKGLDGAEFVSIEGGDVSRAEVSYKDGKQVFYKPAPLTSSMPLGWMRDTFQGEAVIEREDIPEGAIQFTDNNQTFVYSDDIREVIGKVSPHSDTSNYKIVSFGDDLGVNVRGSNSLTIRTPEGEQLHLIESGQGRWTGSLLANQKGLKIVRDSAGGIRQMSPSFARVSQAREGAVLQQMRFFKKDGSAFTVGTEGINVGTGPSEVQGVIFTPSKLTQDKDAAAGGAAKLLADKEARPIALGRYRDNPKYQSLALDRIYTPAGKEIAGTGMLNFTGFAVYAEEEGINNIIYREGKILNPSRLRSLTDHANISAASEGLPESPRFIQFSQDSRNPVTGEKFKDYEEAAGFYRENKDMPVFLRDTLRDGNDAALFVDNNFTLAEQARVRFDRQGTFTEKGFWVAPDKLSRNRNDWYVTYDAAGDIHGTLNVGVLKVKTNERIELVDKLRQSLDAVNKLQPELSAELKSATTSDGELVITDLTESALTKLNEIAEHMPELSSIVEDIKQRRANIQDLQGQLSRLAPEEEYSKVEPEKAAEKWDSLNAQLKREVQAGSWILQEGLFNISEKIKQDSRFLEQYTSLEDIDRVHEGEIRTLEEQLIQASGSQRTVLESRIRQEKQNWQDDRIKLYTLLRERDYANQIKEADKSETSLGKQGAYRLIQRAQQNENKALSNINVNIIPFNSASRDGNTLRSTTGFAVFKDLDKVTAYLPFESKSGESGNSVDIRLHVNDQVFNALHATKEKALQKLGKRENKIWTYNNILSKTGKKDRKLRQEILGLSEEYSNLNYDLSQAGVDFFGEVLTSEVARPDIISVAPFTLATARISRDDSSIYSSFLAKGPFYLPSTIDNIDQRLKGGLYQYNDFINVRTHSGTAGREAPGSGQSGSFPSRGQTMDTSPFRSSTFLELSSTENNNLSARGTQEFILVNQMMQKNFSQGSAFDARGVKALTLLTPGADSSNEGLVKTTEVYSLSQIDGLFTMGGEHAGGVQTLGKVFQGGEFDPDTPRTLGNLPTFSVVVDMFGYTKDEDDELVKKLVARSTAEAHITGKYGVDTTPFDNFDSPQNERLFLLSQGQAESATADMSSALITPEGTIAVGDLSMQFSPVESHSGLYRLKGKGPGAALWDNHTVLPHHSDLRVDIVSLINDGVGPDPTGQGTPAAEPLKGAPDILSLARENIRYLLASSEGEKLSGGKIAPFASLAGTGDLWVSKFGQVNIFHGDDLTTSDYMRLRRNIALDSDRNTIFGLQLDEDTYGGLVDQKPIDGESTPVVTKEQWNTLTGALGVQEEKNNFNFGRNFLIKDFGVGSQALVLPGEKDGVNYPDFHIGFYKPIVGKNGLELAEDRKLWVENNAAGNILSFTILPRDLDGYSKLVGTELRPTKEDDFTLSNHWLVVSKLQSSLYVTQPILSEIRRVGEKIKKDYPGIDKAQFNQRLRDEIVDVFIDKVPESRLSDADRKRFSDSLDVILTLKDEQVSPSDKVDLTGYHDAVIALGDTLAKISGQQSFFQGGYGLELNVKDNKATFTPVINDKLRDNLKYTFDISHEVEQGSNFSSLAVPANTPIPALSAPFLIDKQASRQAKVLKHLYGEQVFSNPAQDTQGGGVLVPKDQAPQPLQKEQPLEFDQPKTVAAEGPKAILHHLGYSLKSPLMNPVLIEYTLNQKAPLLTINDYIFSNVRHFEVGEGGAFFGWGGGILREWEKGSKIDFVQKGDQLIPVVNGSWKPAFANEVQFVEEETADRFALIVRSPRAWLNQTSEWNEAEQKFDKLLITPHKYKAEDGKWNIVKADDNVAASKFLFVGSALDLGSKDISRFDFNADQRSSYWNAGSKQWALSFRNPDTKNFFNEGKLNVENIPTDSPHLAPRLILPAGNKPGEGGINTSPDNFLQALQDNVTSIGINYQQGKIGYIDYIEGQAKFIPIAQFDKEGKYEFTRQFNELSLERKQEIIQEWQKGERTLYSRDKAFVVNLGWAVDSALNVARSSAGMPGFNTYIDTKGGARGVTGLIKDVTGRGVDASEFKQGPLSYQEGLPLVTSMDTQGRPNLIWQGGLYNDIYNEGTNFAQVSRQTEGAGKVAEFVKVGQYKNNDSYAQLFGYHAYIADIATAESKKRDEISADALVSLDKRALVYDTHAASMQQTSQGLSFLGDKANLRGWMKLAQTEAGMPLKSLETTSPTGSFKWASTLERSIALFENGGIYIDPRSPISTPEKDPDAGTRPPLLMSLSREEATKASAKTRMDGLTEYDSARLAVNIGQMFDAPSVNIQNADLTLLPGDSLRGEVERLGKRLSATVTPLAGDTAGLISFDAMGNVEQGLMEFSDGTVQQFEKLADNMRLFTDGDNIRYLRKGDSIMREDDYKNIESFFKKIKVELDPFEVTSEQLDELVGQFEIFVDSQTKQEKVFKRLEYDKLNGFSLFVNIDNPDNRLLINKDTGEIINRDKHIPLEVTDPSTGETSTRHLFRVRDTDELVD